MSFPKPRLESPSRGEEEEKKEKKINRLLPIYVANFGLFTEIFLYGFIVPLVPPLLTTHLRHENLPTGTEGQLDATVQTITSALLAMHGAIAVVFSPVIAHFGDRTPDRRLPMLISLVGCAIGTVVMATAQKLWLIFAGRTIQAASGSAAWISCFALLADVTPPERLGVALGTSMSVITAGLMTGPAAAGVMVDVAGFWAAWAVPLGLLLIGFVGAWFMKVVPYEEKMTMPEGLGREAVVEATTQDETTALLRHTSGNHNGARKRKTGFYRLMLWDIQVIAALTNTWGFSLVVSGFEATLPFFLKKKFQWGSFAIGAVFMVLQVPGLILGPVIGWVRDKQGLRFTTTLGWLLMAPLLIALGFPGKFISVGKEGQAVFVTGIVLIGMVSPLKRGAGVYQLTATMHRLLAKDPNVFGPYGGTSRLFSITQVTFNLGMLFGPLIAGGISETLGFFWSNCVFALMSIIIAATSFVFLTNRPIRRDSPAF